MAIAHLVGDTEAPVDFGAMAEAMAGFTQGMLGYASPSAEGEPPAWRPPDYLCG
jgi:hypothetical protein